MKYKFTLCLFLAFLALSLFPNTSYAEEDPVETRYMRGDQHNINGLTAYILGDTQSATSQYHRRVISSGFSALASWGIRVWKRSSGGVETEITSGTPVAAVYRMEDGSGIQSNTWACPGADLSSDDAIVVRVYLTCRGNTYLCAEFITEQLDAETLEAATWTVYYHTAYSFYSSRITATFRWGTVTYNSRIEGFSYTSAVATHKLNLKIMDWDLADAIPNAYVYLKNDTSSYMKTSDSNGWANWTGISGTVYVNVSYYGFWVNGTFTITVSADTTLDVRCNLYDVYIQVLPANQQGILYTANVTVFNGTSVEANKIRTALSNQTGYVYLPNLPNNTLTFTVYAKTDYSLVIANVTHTPTSDEQTLTAIVCDQNYGTTLINWEIIMIPVSAIIQKKLKRKQRKE